MDADLLRMNYLSTPARTEAESECGLCPLNRVRAGLAVRIKQLCAAPAVADRLREMGFGEDQVVRLLTARTNIICQVCNARLALSQALAESILVEPVMATAIA